MCMRMSRKSSPQVTASALRTRRASRAVGGDTLNHSTNQPSSLLLGHSLENESAATQQDGSRTYLVVENLQRWWYFMVLLESTLFTPKPLTGTGLSLGNNKCGRLAGLRFQSGGARLPACSRGHEHLKLADGRQRTSSAPSRTNTRRASLSIVCCHISSATQPNCAHLTVATVFYRMTTHPNTPHYYSEIMYTSRDYT